MKNLACLSSAELKSFLNSFDNILCDCDGVVWTRNKPILGIKETLLTLKKYGKNVRFVSNNCTVGLEGFCNKFRKLALEVQSDDIIYPTQAIIDYLKKIKYDKEIFIIGCSVMKQDFSKEGFIIADSGPYRVDENFEGVSKNIKDNEKVGAVVFDHDYNLNYIKFLKALVYLQRPEVLFFTGASDNMFPVGLEMLMLGPGKFQKILEDFTGRTPLAFGKPGLNYNKFIMEKYKISDPSRTLFIGDSLEQDMEFAAKFGYQKLLVLTGVTSFDQVESCMETGQIPDYYVNSLGDLHNLLKNKLQM